MPHQPGEDITIASYNDIVTLINNLFGTGNGDSGYGGNSTNVALSNLVNKTAGSIITNEDWLVLRDAQFDLAAHQGTTLPDALPDITNMEDADTIQAFESPDVGLDPGQIDSVANFNLLVANRGVVSPGNVAVATTLTSVRSTSWSSFIEHELIVDFGSADNARFFFNTGGEIRIDADRAGGSATAQNANWDSILASVGALNFGGNGYFALTSAFSALPPVGRTVTSGYGYYGANSWTISAKRDDAAGSNGGNGSIIRFKSSFLDGHTNVFFDQVDGTFTSTIEERRSTGIFVRPTPTFTTIIPLTSGN